MRNENTTKEKVKSIIADMVRLARESNIFNTSLNENDDNDDNFEINNNVSDDSHWVINKNYFIRTITHHFTGRLLKVSDKEIVLDKCSWIADDGRFHNAMIGEGFKEIEPYKPESKVILGRGAILDAHIYDYELPREQK